MSIDSLNVISEKLSGPVNVNLYKKILYISAIDCLSVIRFPELRSKNRDKFLRFIDECAGWEERNFVSVPIIKERLKAVKGYTRLKRNINRILDDCVKYYGCTIDIYKIDKLADDLNILTSNKCELKIIEETRHRLLLYKYRNFIVHEFRELGYAMGVFGERSDFPIYHGYVGEKNWVLLYPVGFFRRLLENSIENMEIYLHENKIDPYDHVRNTADWFTELDIARLRAT